MVHWLQNAWKKWSSAGGVGEIDGKEGHAILSEEIRQTPPPAWERACNIKFFTFLRQSQHHLHYEFSCRASHFTDCHSEIDRGCGYCQSRPFLSHRPSCKFGTNLSKLIHKSVLPANILNKSMNDCEVLEVTDHDSNRVINATFLFLVKNLYHCRLQLQWSFSLGTVFHQDISNNMQYHPLQLEPV